MGAFVTQESGVASAGLEALEQLTYVRLKVNNSRKIELVATLYFKH
jgi:hypothetical protein